MLRAGKAKAEPVVTSESAKPPPVWPCRISRSSESDMELRDNEDYVPVPQYQDTLRNAIEEALNRATAQQTQKGWHN